jgi:hypothetical protein
MRKIDDIRICGACLTVVDGDPSMGDGATQEACATAAAGMAERWEDGQHIHGVGSEQDEGGFSHSACEGCGDPLGGTRYMAVVLVDEGSAL